LVLRICELRVRLLHRRRQLRELWQRREAPVCRRRRQLLLLLLLKRQRLRWELQRRCERLEGLWRRRKHARARLRLRRQRRRRQQLHHGSRHHAGQASDGCTGNWRRRDAAWGGETPRRTTSAPASPGCRGGAWRQHVEGLDRRY
jgi:hypothetical protein